MGADEPEHELQDMEHRSAQLDDEIDDVRGDWRRKQQDPAVPGAEPPDEERDDGPSETQEEPGGPSG